MSQTFYYYRNQCKRRYIQIYMCLKCLRMTGLPYKSYMRAQIYNWTWGLLGTGRPSSYQLRKSWKWCMHKHIPLPHFVNTLFQVNVFTSYLVKKSKRAEVKKRKISKYFTFLTAIHENKILNISYLFSSLTCVVICTKINYSIRVFLWLHSRVW